MTLSVGSFTQATVFSLVIIVSVYGSSRTQLLQETVTASGASATITVTQMGRDIKIDGDFVSRGYPVACISIYGDLRYDLLNAAGQAVSIDQQTIKHPPLEETTLPTRVAIKVKYPNCASSSEHERRLAAALFYLYPRLPAGKYTLNITFAPRRGSQRARLTPIHFTTMAVGRDPAP